MKKKKNIFYNERVFFYLQHSYGQWQIVFGILAGTYIFGALAFVVLGSGELQPWNNPPERIRKVDVEQIAEEAVPLKKNKIQTD